jgi:YgiT-type zinc finger domain-containing protein
MKCVVCRGDEIKPQEIKEQLQIDEDIVFVRVRIPVCQTCGERYYDRKTVAYLEEIEQKLKSGHAQLDQVGRVLEYR